MFKLVSQLFYFFSLAGSSMPREHQRSTNKKKQEDLKVFQRLIFLAHQLGHLGVVLPLINNIFKVVVTHHARLYLLINIATGGD